MNSFEHHIVGSRLQRICPELLSLLRVWPWNFMHWYLDRSYISILLKMDWRANITDAFKTFRVLTMSFFSRLPGWGRQWWEVTLIGAEGEVDVWHWFLVISCICCRWLQDSKVSETLGSFGISDKLPLTLDWDRWYPESGSIAGLRRYCERESGLRLLVIWSSPGIIAAWEECLGPMAESDSTWKVSVSYVSAFVLKGLEFP